MCIRDSGSGRVACLLEGLSDGAKLRRQRLAGEILYAVLKLSLIHI